MNALGWTFVAVGVMALFVAMVGMWVLVFTQVATDDPTEDDE